MDNHQNQKRIYSKTPTCIVSGAAGFLGTTICDALLAQNCKLIAIDLAKNFKKETLEKFSKNNNFHLINSDLTTVLSKDLKTVDYVYHLAGAEQFLGSDKLTLEALLVNSVGTEYLAIKAVADRAKFILASTIDVYNGALSGVSLEYYFGPNQNDFAHYSHHEAKRYAEALLAEYYHAKKLDVTICRIAEIYGPGMNLDSESVIARLINQALTAKKIVVKGDGLEIIYPTYIGDVSYGFIKAAFSTDSSGKIFALVPPEGVTVKKFAETLTDIVNNIFSPKKIELVFESESTNLKFPTRQPDTSLTEQILGWETKTNLTAGLIETINYFSKGTNQTQKVVGSDYFFSNQAVKKGFNFSALFSELKLKFRKPKFVKITDAAKDQVKPETASPKGLAFLQLLMCLVLAINLSLFAKIAVDATGSLSALQQSYHLLTQQNFENAQEKSRQSQFFLQKLQTDIEFISRITPDKLPVFNSAQKITNLAINTAYAIDNLSGSAQEFSKLGGEVLKKGGKKQDAIKYLVQSESLFNVAAEKLALAAAEANSIPAKPTPITRINKKVEMAKLRLDIERTNLLKLKPIYQLVPQILGFDEEKNYLIILQNNLELRPTGGFIGSYATIDFDQGHLKKLTIDDVYNIDGQLKEKIIPPEPLRKHLAVENWYLRDSNWDPDLTVSAPTILDFFQKETRQTADAVIAVDVNFIQGLIGLTGPVKLSDFNEIITDQNLFDKAEYYAEIGFTPGSQNKRNFLSSLGSQLLAKLLDPNLQKDFSKTATIVTSAVSQKHLQIYFKDQTVQKLMVDKNWAGKIIPLIDQKTNKISADYLLLVDSNLGANKANNFVTKSVSYHPVIKRDGDLLSEITITYKNNSPANTWPGGNYKNYLRVYTPAGSVIDKISNNQNTDPRQVDVSFASDKVVYGFLVEVPVQKEIKVVLSYRQALLLNEQNGASFYNLIVQKQAGTDKDIFNLTLDFPSYLTLTNVPASANVKTQSIEINSDTQVDRKYKIEFVRN